MFDVISIGSAVRDVFLISKDFKIIESDEFPTGLAECVSLGSKIELDEIVFTTGGGGSNSAATFSNLGFRAAVVSRIADDASGREVLEDLKKFNISPKLMRTLKKGETGYSSLLTTKTGERSVLVHRGVSSEFTAADIPKKLDTKWIYVTSLAGNVKLASAIAGKASQQGVKMAYNPGSLELKKGIRAFKPILNKLDILNVNLEEAQYLAGTKTEDIKKLCKKIQKADFTLIITDGPRGAYASKDGEIWHARTTGAKGISRTGAGDAFGSGLVAAVIKEKTMEDALKIATINAESVIQKHGAKFGLLKRWPGSAKMKEVKVRKLT